MDEIKYYFVVATHEDALRAAISINNAAIEDGRGCLQPFDGQYDPKEEQDITDYYREAIALQPVEIRQHLNLIASTVDGLDDDETMLAFEENMGWPEETLNKIKEAYRRRNAGKS